MSEKMSQEVASEPDAAALANVAVRKEFFANFLKATGTSGASSMSPHDTSSENGSTTSSQATPPEFPSPPPPSNSPPESMASLQAESPTGDENRSLDSGGGGSPALADDVETDGSTTGNVSSDFTGKRTFIVGGKEFKEWVAQHGYHKIPHNESVAGSSKGSFFIHVTDNQTIRFRWGQDNDQIGTVQGPGSVLMVGQPPTVSQALTLNLPPGQQCHQFYDDEVQQAVGGDQQADVVDVNPNNNQGPTPQADPNQPGTAGPPVGPAAGMAPNYGRGTSRGDGHHHSHRTNNNNNNYYNYNNNRVSNQNGGYGRGNGQGRNGQGRHDDYQPRQFNGRGGYRGNRGNGAGRGYIHHGSHREQHQNPQPAIANDVAVDNVNRNMNGYDHFNGNVNVNGGMLPPNMGAAPNMVDVPNMAVAQINGGPPGIPLPANKLVPLMPPQLMAPGGQVSLLGEPTGPPMGMPMAPMMPMAQYAPVPLMMAPPPGEIASQENQLVPPPSVQMTPQCQPGLLQDPVVPGAQLAMVPYLMPPPPGLMTPPGNGSIFYNNKWFERNPPVENEILSNMIRKLKTPVEVQPAVTWFDFEWFPIPSDFLSGTTVQYLAGTFVITYEANIIDESTGFKFKQPIDPSVVEVTGGVAKCTSRLSALRPNTNYKLRLKASIIDRGLSGNLSDKLKFRTSPGRPDEPFGVSVLKRTDKMISVIWQEPVNNGATIFYYDVYVTAEGENGRVMTVTKQKAEIHDLQPETHYRIAITAHNALGESLVPARLEAYTRSATLPTMPQEVEVVAISHRSIRVTWKFDPYAKVFVETTESPEKMPPRVVQDLFDGCVAIVAELEPRSTHFFRVSARNDNGVVSTEWIEARTQKYYENFNYEFSKKYPRYERLPSMPVFVGYKDHIPEYGWSTSNATTSSGRDHVYVVEGATFEDPGRWQEIYRGNLNSIYIYDENIHFIRLYDSYKKGQKSRTTAPVLVQRDHLKYRTTDVPESLTIKKTKDGLIASWEGIWEDRDRYPSTAQLYHQVQRTDVPDSDVYDVMDTDENGLCHLLWRPIPSGTSISLRVRGLLSFRDIHVPGDWSPSVTYKEPKYPPRPVSAISYSIESSTLTWECADELDPDIQFTVEVLSATDGLSLQKVITREKNLVVDGLSLGQKYKAVITSSNSIGSAKPTTQGFRIPPQKPGVPKDMLITNVGTENCSVTFTEAIPNGARILGYAFEIKKAGTLDKPFRTGFIEAHEDGYRVKLTDLPANSKFVMTISARNSVGLGEGVILRFKTNAVRPVAPLMEADCEPNTVKLKWEHVTTGASISYKVTRRNSNEHWQTAYEGSNNSVRVKNLEENTDYDFQLEVIDRDANQRALSNIQTFRTTTAPPPPFKKSVTCTLMPGETHLYRVTWDNVLSAKSKAQQFYRLQTVDATIQGAKFETIYEGTTPSYELDTQSFPEGLHVRVLCIRNYEGKEIKGGSSPSYFLANIPPEIEEAEPEEPVNRMNELFNRLMNSNMTIVLSMGFMLMFCCLMIYFSEPFFQWLLGASSNDQAYSHTPSPSQTNVEPPTPMLPPGNPGRR